MQAQEAMAVRPKDRPFVSPEVVLREDFEDWAVLFQPLTGEAVGTSPTGVAIWKMLDGRRTLAELAGEIGTLYGVPSDTALQDMLAFVRDLERRLFLQLEDGG